MQGREQGGERGIVFHKNIARIGDFSVGPFVEDVACVAVRNQVDDFAIVVGSAAVDET